MKIKEKENDEIFKRTNKTNFFLVLSKLNCKYFVGNIPFFVFLQIIEILQMVYFTYSTPIIGTAAPSETLLLNVQSILKYSIFTVAYRDGLNFTSIGPLSFDSVFIFFSIYTFIFLILAILNVYLERHSSLALKKTISMVSRILSLIFYVNFFILSFPAYQLFSIPFECLLNSGFSSYLGAPYACYDSKHLAYLSISVICLLIWMVFNGVFSLFVYEYFQESNIPWSGQVTKNNFILFLWKITASVFLFAFRSSNISSTFILGIIVVNMISVYIRYKTPFIFNETVYFLYSIRECVIFILSVINFTKAFGNFTFDASFLLQTLFIIIAFVFSFFRLVDRSKKNLQLRNPFELKEVNEVELYTMYFIYKIGFLEEKEIRRDLYGMFLIHQEKCGKSEIYDPSKEIEYKCPCQEIIDFLQKLNFHKSAVHKDANIDEKKEEDLNKTEINNLIDKNPEEGSEENSENKAIIIKDYYKKAFDDLREKLYLYIKYLLIYHIMKKPKTAKLHLLFAYLNHMKLRKLYKSLFEIMQAKYSKGSTIDKFLVYRYNEMLENDINKTNVRAEKDYCLNIKELITFILNYKNYFDLMENISHNSVEFWQEFDNDQPNTNKIYKIGDYIANEYQRLMKYKDYFTENYYNHFAINFTYGCFLKYILNNNKEANVIIKNALTSKTKLDHSNISCDIRMNHEAGIVMISGDLMTFCQIIYSNNNISLMLGFTVKELINSNVNMIVPKFLSVKHDIYVKNFLESGVKNILDREITLFAKNKKGFLIPTIMNIRMIPDLSSGVRFIGCLLALDTKNEKLRPNPDLIINDIYLVCADTNFKFLGVTQNCYDNLGLIFSNHTEKKFKDLTLQDFIDVEKHKKIFENLTIGVNSNPIDLEIKVGKIKEFLDLLEIPNLPTLNFKELSEKKFQMTIDLHHAYKNQIRFYVIKLWEISTTRTRNKGNTSRKENKSIHDVILLDEVNSTVSMDDSATPAENNNFSKSASDEKSSFLQSEGISDSSIDCFKIFINFLIYPFFALILAQYITFFIDKSNKIDQVVFDFNIIATSIHPQRLLMMMRSNLNSLNGYEPRQFKVNDFPKYNFDKMGFLHFSMNNSVNVVNNLTNTIVQNSYFYTKNIDKIQLQLLMIDLNSSLKNTSIQMYPYIYDFCQQVIRVINYPLDSSDRLLSNFSIINTSNSYNYNEKNNFFYLINTLNSFLPAYWNLVDTEFGNSSSDSLLVQSLLIFFYASIFTSILLTILYYSKKIKRRKTLYINYFTEIEEKEIARIKESCINFFKFLNGEIVFNDFLKIEKKGVKNGNDSSRIIENKHDIQNSINSPRSPVAKKSNENFQIIMKKTEEFKLDNINFEDISEIRRQSKKHSMNNIKASSLKDNLKNSPSKMFSLNLNDIQKFKEIESDNDVKMQNTEKPKIVKKPRFVEPEIKTIEKIESIPKEGGILKKDLELKNEVPSNLKSSIIKEVVAPPEKTEKEMKIINKKNWILNSSNNDKNSILYFIFAGSVLFAIFTYLFLSVQQNLISSFNAVQTVTYDNYIREKEFISFLTYSREILSLKQQNNSEIFKNYKSQNKIISNMTQKSFLVDSSSSFSFLSNLFSQDFQSTSKNAYCTLITSYNTSFNYYLNSTYINLDQCQNINNGVLQNGIFYFIHQSGQQIDSMIQQYFASNQNSTQIIADLNNENILSIQFIYFQFITIYFDNFLNQLSISFNGYMSFLTMISFLYIFIFFILIVLGIIFIIKVFYQDIKNARGIICIIPSKYLKPKSKKKVK